MTVTLPTTRLHLVTVDAQGRARLKLRPRFELNAEQRVVRIDAPPMFDAPPTLDDLCREAGRNHQLEHAFHAEHSVTRQAERDTDRQRRADIAEAFLKDPARRPLRRPTPTPERCHLGTSDGRMLFDISKDDGPARLVPPEAYRRFRADLARAQRHGGSRRPPRRSPRTRTSSAPSPSGSSSTALRSNRRGMPMASCPWAKRSKRWPTRRSLQVTALNDTRSTALARLQARLRQLPHYAHVTVNPTDLTIVGTDAVTATEAQWALVQQLRRVFPDATVTLREHRIAWKGDHQAPTLTLFGVIVTRKMCPFDLRREYAAPDA